MGASDKAYDTMRRSDDIVVKMLEQEMTAGRPRSTAEKRKLYQNMTMGDFANLLMAAKHNFGREMKDSEEIARAHMNGEETGFMKDACPACNFFAEQMAIDNKIAKERQTRK